MKESLSVPKRVYSLSELVEHLFMAAHETAELRGVLSHHAVTLFGDYENNPIMSGSDEPHERHITEKLTNLLDLIQLTNKVIKNDLKFMSEGITGPSINKADLDGKRIDKFS